MTKFNKLVSDWHTLYIFMCASLRSRNKYDDDDV